MSERHEDEVSNQQQPSGLGDACGNSGGGSGPSSAKPAFDVKELLIDGSFEQSTAGANSWTHAKSVGGWKSDTEIETWGKDFYGLKATDGNKIAELDFDNRASNIFQDVTTGAGAEYTFSFDYMKRPDSKAGSDTINVFWNGKLVGTVDPTKSEWAKAEFKVNGTGGNDRIEFRESGDDNDSYGGLLDNASLKQSGPSTAQKEAAEKIAAAEKTAAEKTAAEKAAADKEAADKVAAEKAAYEAAHKEDIKLATADKEAADKVAAEKAASDAAHKEDIKLTTADAHDVVTGTETHGSNHGDGLTGGKGDDLVSGHGGNDVIHGDLTASVTVGLKIDVSLVNAADTNAVELTLSGLPKDAVLSAGVHNDDGTWTLWPNDLAGLTVTTPDSADFDVTVAAHATDGSGLAATSVIHVTMLTGSDDELYGAGKWDGVDRPHDATYQDNDTIFGGAGNDRIWGNAGDDTLYGESGNDAIYGGKGNDHIEGGKGDNTLFGNSGDDVFVAGGGNDKIVGGSGFDSIDFSGASGGVNVNLHAHTATGFGNDSLSGIEAVIGSAFDDVFTADGKHNVFTGGAGSDTFVWGRGDAKHGADTITDFEIGDHIDLSAVTKGNASNLQIKDDGTNTHVMAFVGKAWIEVVTLDGFTGHGQDELLKGGAILV